MAAQRPVPENLLPDGTYDPRMYELDYQKEPREKGVPTTYRVIRGLGNHIGYVRKLGNSGLWQPLDVDKQPIDDPRLGYQRRWVAAFEVTGHVPLTQDAEIADPDAFRVDRKEDTPA